MPNSSYKIAALPKPSRLLGLLARPRAPLVMSNFLQFRDKAKFKRFSGMTGQEAYGVYAESAMVTQSTMGSRIIWASEDVKKIAGSDAPNFEAIAFLEYASPGAFLKFVVLGDYDSEARSAGLKGQWLLASSTIEESASKGLIGVALVEIFSIKGGKKGVTPDWFDAWKEVKLGNGGVIVWEGSADSQPIGYAAKTPSIIVVTQFPDLEALQNALATDEAAGIKNLVADRLEDYLAYQAYPTDKWQDMLSKETAI
jgi:uncharacterized protein (DUF1330 family)